MTMPRCCVPGCDTGTSAEIVRTRKAKARNKSTFLLPADYGLYKKWEKVLGLKYDTNNGRSGRVCELHFEEADIIRHYYKQMENGTVQQFTFSRPTLKKGIIPLSFPREEDLLPQGHKNNKNKKKMKVSIEQNNNCGSTPGKKRRSSFENDDAVPEKRPKRTNAKKVGKIPKNYEKRNYKRQIKTPRNKLISNSVKKRTPLIYDFDKLMHNLKRRNCKVPKGWEFSIIDEDTFQFTYNLGSAKKFLTCTLKREIFLEIKAFNPNAIINLEFKFLSQAHLIENLMKLQMVQCCKGITYKIFSKQCKGFIPFDVKHKKLENFGRCILCKKLWDNFMRIQSHCRLKRLKRLRPIASRIKRRAKMIKYLKKTINGNITI